ncbi:MAG: DUF4115 domain-containing protein [Ferrimonas sp.]
MTDDLTQEASIVSPGSLLRDAREAMGLTPQQVAQRLNLRQSVVLGIEQDHFEAGMSVTYVRGYIRNYARLVGINEKDLAPALDQIYRSNRADEMQSFSGRAARERHDTRWVLLTWVMGLLLIAVFVWWALFSPKESEKSLAEPAFTLESRITTEVVNEPQPMMAEAEPRIEIVVEEQSRDDANSQPIDDALSEPVEVVTDLAPTAETVVTVEAMVADQTDNQSDALIPTLTLSLNDDCWLRVQDANGKRLLEGLRSKGFTTELSGTAPFRLRLGAPEAVSLTYNGQAIDLSSFRAGQVANLTVPQ